VLPQRLRRDLLGVTTVGNPDHNFNMQISPIDFRNTFDGCDVSVI
jgi:hypothetical protein